MTTISLAMRFTRDQLRGFASQNRVSTDALNALERWRGLDARRAYKVTDGEESRDYLLAVLSTDRGDNAAAEALDRACAECGVSRVIEE